MNKDKIVYSIVVILTPLYRINDKQNIQLSQYTIHIFYVKHKKLIMKALVYHGPRDVQIDNKPRPSIV